MTTVTVNNRKTYLKKKIHDVLVVLGFLDLLKTLQYILTYLGSIENILILFCHSFYIYSKKINLHTLINFHPLT